MSEHTPKTSKSQSSGATHEGFDTPQEVPLDSVLLLQTQLGNAQTRQLLARSTSQRRFSGLPPVLGVLHRQARPVDAAAQPPAGDADIRQSIEHELTSRMMMRSQARPVHLRPEQIQQALDRRSFNAEFNTAFNQAVIRVEQQAARDLGSMFSIFFRLFFGGSQGTSTSSGTSSTTPTSTSPNSGSGTTSGTPGNFVAGSGRGSTSGSTAAPSTAVGAAPAGPAVPPPTTEMILNEQADRLVHMIELQFIHDPQASGLDLLPPDQRDRYRNFRWGENDFPGGPAGANEGRAGNMRRDLSALSPERRPHTGGHTIVSEGQEPGLRAYIIAELVHVPGQTRFQLNRLASEAFVQMREAAQRDQVSLSLIDAFRPQAVSRSRAAASGNASAVASYSAHNLGLAIDLRMSSGRQRFAEATTRPMQNVVDMRQSPAHKWMLLNASQYGWYPYHNEPWHWEYNPPGFRDQFFQNASQTQRSGH